MKFSSHEERKQHPLAGMIPDYMWNRYFNHGIDDKLLKLMSLSEEELCKEVIDLFRNSTDEANCFAFAAPESSCTATYTAVQRAATPRTSLSSESFERSLMKVELGADEETKIFLAILFSHKDLSKNTLNIIINKVGIDCERAFSVAAEFGLIEILQSLEDLFPDKLQDMIKAENYSAFRFAAKNGQVNVLEYLERKIQPPATLQDMIKANNYKAIPYHAFLLAAENGQVKVLEYLESKIKPPATLQDMINQYTYVVFSKAARGGRVDVLKYLESKIQPPATLQDMIKANNYAAFYFAAKNGHLEVLEYLETKIQPPATLQGMIKANYYAEFYEAAANNQINVLEYLEKKTPSLLQDMIKANHYAAFRFAAKNGHLEVLEYLETKIQPPAALQDMIKANNYTAFSKAARLGHVKVLEYLWAKIQPQAVLKDMIKANDYSAFSCAAANSHIEVLEYLEKKAPGLLQDMIKANNYSAFSLAAANGHIEVLEYLEKKVPGLLQDMIKANNYAAFRFAAKNGHLEVLEYLETKIQPKAALQDMIKADKNAAFNLAVKNGHVNVLEYLEAKIQPKEALQDMIKANNYNAFICAAYNGHVNVLEYLEAKIQPKEALQDMIKAKNYNAFICATYNGHANVLNFLMSYDVVRTEAFRLIASGGLSYDIWTESSHSDLKELLKHPAIFAHACSHHADKIKPFIAEQIQKLKARQAHGNPPRLLHNKQEAECLFYLLHYLIEKIGIEAKDNILFLLKIPELQALLPTERQPHNTNNLALRAAISKRRTALAEAAESWNEIIRAFYIIPEVFDQAERDGNYRTETQGQIDLRAIANNSESSMRAATQEEIAQLKKLSDHYQPKIQELKSTGGTEGALGAATGLISEYYHTHQATFKNTTGEEVTLPLLWDDFQKLNLTKEDRELALKAYYTNQVHSAYRLFLKPNPWIASNAGYTEASEGGRAARFTGYEETMAVLILAAFDKEFYIGVNEDASEACNKAEDSSAKSLSFTDERISLLCLALSDITRAHNWDKSRPKTDAKGKVVFEQYDDLEADKPSCINGVSTRLMQSIAGHPLFIPIDVIAEESVREYLQHMINSKLSYLGTRPHSKLAEESEVRGDAEHRTAVYVEVHEDSSTAATKQFASSVEFEKRSNELLQELYTYGQNVLQANAVDERTAQQFQLIFTQDNYNALMHQVLNKYQKLLQEKGESEEVLKIAIDERLLELSLIDLPGKSTNKNLWIDLSDYFNYTQEQIKRIAVERKVVLTSIDLKPDEPAPKPGVLEGAQGIIKLYIERAKEAARVSQESVLSFIQATNEEELKVAWQKWTPKTNNEKLLSEDLKRNYPDFFALKQTKCSYADLPDWYQKLAQAEARNQQSSRYRLFRLPPALNPRGSVIFIQTEPRTLGI